MKNKKQESFVLGKLDKKTLLVATPQAFVIKEKTKKSDGEIAWANKYYYSELGDAIRGYARHALRRPSTAKHLDGNLKKLIDIVMKLESTIKKVGDRLSVKFEEQLQDPIESHIFHSGDDT